MFGPTERLHTGQIFCPRFGLFASGPWRCCCGSRGRTVPTAAAAALLITSLRLDGKVGTVPGGNIPAGNAGIAREGIVGAKCRAASTWADGTLRATKDAAFDTTFWTVKVGGPVVGTLVALTFRGTKVAGFDATVEFVDVSGRSARAAIVAVGARGVGAKGFDATFRGVDEGTSRGWVFVATFPFGDAT